MIKAIAYAIVGLATTGTGSLAAECFTIISPTNPNQEQCKEVARTPDRQRIYKCCR